MKRTLITSIFGVGISVFFTGCSSLITSNTTSNMSSVVEKVKETRSESMIWETEEAMEAPDYHEVNEAEKYDNLEGKQAFKIKDGHSQDTADMNSFSIGTYLEGGTFLYAYSTRVGEKTGSDSSNDSRKIVHCAAAYNYETGDFKVFHEKTFTRTDESLESLYIQTLENGSGDVFIYDNGYGYLYDSTLNLTYNVSLEPFVRDMFHEGESGYAYSITATHAMTDGNDRIYVDLTLEKEEITEAEEVNPYAEDDTSEEDADKEAEELDEEVEAKTIELILVCDMKSISRTIDQVNLNFDNQAEDWKNMTEDEIYTSVPDAEADWKSVKEDNPDNWGVAHLYNMEPGTWDDDKLKEYGLEGQEELYGTPVFRFKDSKTFDFKDTYVNTFHPKEGTYEGFFDLQGDSDLTDVFIIYQDHYYELFGRVESLGNTSKSWDSAEYFSKSITREYTYQWTETTTDSDGNESEEEYEETREQTISKYTERDASLTGEQIIGYWTLYDKGLRSAIAVVKDRILCMDKSTLYWLKSDGSTEKFHEFDENSIIEFYQEGNAGYLIITGETEIKIHKIDLTKDNWCSWNQIAGTWTISNEQMTQTIEAKDPGAKSVDSFYHNMHNESEEDLLNETVQSGKELIQGNMLLKVNVDAKKSKLEQLEAAGVAAGAANASGDGFLITSFANGLLYYDHGSGKVIQLLDGTWYESWKDGDKVISIGFSNEQSSYGTLDVAVSRVKEYKIDSLYENGINAILASYTNEVVEETQETDEDSEALMEKAKEMQQKKNEAESVAPRGTLSVDVVDMLE